MPVFQPSNQIKLTNVSVVRLRKCGHRFEIACYKNKVREWRTHVETDVSEVVQIDTIFVNVSKGLVAPTSWLQDAFGTTDTSRIVEEMLKRGELQVGEKEREHELANMWREIAMHVAGMCVDPTSQRAYTVGMVEKAMAEVHYSVKTGRSAKQQALEVVRLLQHKNTMPIQRAKMRVRVTMASKHGKSIKHRLVGLVDTVEQEDWTDGWELIALVDPGAFKSINQLVHAEIKAGAVVETLNFTTVEGDGDKTLE